MDKDVMKRLLREANIPIARFRSYGRNDRIAYEDLTAELGRVLFVKPANLGSSVGVRKATTKDEFESAVRYAFEFDRKILVEECIQGREVECAVLGNDAPIASCVGEIIPQHDFYSYDAKYIDDNGARLEVPAKISEKESERIRDLAIRTFKVLCAEGLARVDCFLRADGSVLVNEINTMPGFTKISMYPRLWAESGIMYPDLIDRLIKLGIERFERDRALKTSQ
jgi:D-alanine-D-alanine ligase